MRLSLHIAVRDDAGHVAPACSKARKIFLRAMRLTLFFFAPSDAPFNIRAKIR